MSRILVFPAFALLLGASAPAQVVPLPTTPAKPAAQAEVAPLDAIAAIVGDQPITRYELREQVFGMIQRGMPAPTTDSAQRALAYQVLNDMIEDELIRQKGKELKIEVPEAEVASAADKQLRETRLKFPSEAEFRTALTQSGMGTPEEYRTYLVDQYRRAGLRE